MDWASDLDALYADLGEPVTRESGAAGFAGMLDVADRYEFDMLAQAGALALRYPTASAPDLEPDEILVIAGRRHQVRAWPKRLHDGAECVVALSDALA